VSAFQAWAESVSLWQVVGWTAGLVGAVLFVVWFKRKGWPWLQAFARAIIKTAEVVNAVQELPEFITRTDATLAAQDEQIADIHHEVHFNNGSSVKDAVTRVETTVQTEILPRLEQISERLPKEES